MTITMTSLDFEEVRDVLTHKELEYALLERSIGDFCDQKLASLVLDRDNWQAKCVQLQQQLREANTRSSPLSMETFKSVVLVTPPLKNLCSIDHTSQVSILSSTTPRLTLVSQVASTSCFPTLYGSPPRTVYRKPPVGHSDSSDDSLSPRRGIPKHPAARCPSRMSLGSFASFASVRAISSSDSDGSLDDLVSTTLRLSRTSQNRGVRTSFGSTSSSLVRYSTESSRKRL